ncbi:RNA 2',3'-cyclic phosphodiesterase [Candidatus Sordicultor fermentans]|jgi:2'-5' RNA ligase|uniref:RNA 2',3'-cyclic phosphodiesterase n=1 Tax=Candidatus Sordicultor fermentans TaxID=1953203 RepID=UPI001690CAC3|nr:RNA 2',3'-cyclic phosphodiesterase [Candidatus Atribacteria bacterium]
MSSTTIRSFVALDLPSEAQDFLEELINEEKKLYPQAKWVKREQLHLTLHFFHAFPLGEVEEMNKILEEVSNKFTAFPVTLERWGAFPSLHRARVVWIGVDREGEGKIKSIREEVEKGIAAKGWEREDREFSPHITLARFRSPFALPSLGVENINFSTEIKKLVFYQSTLTPRGSVYQQLGVFSLEGVKKNE